MHYEEVSEVLPLRNHERANNDGGYCVVLCIGSAFTKGCCIRIMVNVRKFVNMAINLESPQ